MIRIIRFLLSVVFVMLNESAFALEPVKYLDENGQEQWVSDYTILTGGETILTSGWYVVSQSELVSKEGVSIDGDVRIIMCDNTVWSLGTEEYNDSYSPFYSVRNHTCLRFYAQSTGENMGRIVESSAKLERFDSADFINVDSLVINGGIIECDGGNGYFDLFNAMDFTMNGGCVALLNARKGIVCSNVHLNGGKLVVTASDYAIGVGGELSFGKSYCDFECECSSFLYYGDSDVSISDFVCVKIGDTEYLGTIPYNFTDVENVTCISSHYNAEAAALSVVNVCDVEDTSAWYTLSGLRLKSIPVEKGVYIHNGSKIQIR